MKKKKNTPGRIVNRRARFDYELGADLVAGIMLSGRETKALRQGHGHLRGAFVTVKDGELMLTNATIASGKNFDIPSEEQTRSRKLLANKKQIKALIDSKQQGNTIVPLEFIISGRFIKIRIATGRGKKNYDKRESLKKRDQMRDAERNY